MMCGKVTALKLSTKMVNICSMYITKTMVLTATWLRKTYLMHIYQMSASVSDEEMASGEKNQLQLRSTRCHILSPKFDIHQQRPRNHWNLKHLLFMIQSFRYPVCLSWWLKYRIMNGRTIQRQRLQYIVHFWSSIFSQAQWFIISLCTLYI